VVVVVVVVLLVVLRAVSPGVVRFQKSFRASSATHKSRRQTMAKPTCRPFFHLTCGKKGECALSVMTIMAI